jgi:hypothetical protein
MRTINSIQPLVLLLALSLALVGCDGFDSGASPDAPEDVTTTLSFGDAEVALTEESGTVSIPVVINNPAGRQVSAEVLYADGVSTTDASDFNLPADAAVSGGNAYVVGSVTFPADAEDGDMLNLELNIQDAEDNEDQEDGIFVLQSLQNATVGSQDRFTVKIGAIQILFVDFSDDTLDPMTAFSVASNENWGTGSFSGEPLSPYAEANGFDANEPSNDWLIAPAINFNDYDGETLTFQNAKNFDDAGLDRGLQVKISTDYDGTGNPEDFTWTDVSDRVQNYSTGGYEFVSSGEVDLSDTQFQGDAVYIAFQYETSGTGGGSTELWRVDDITVTGQ